MGNPYAPPPPGARPTAPERTTDTDTSPQAADAERTRTGPGRPSAQLPRDTPPEPADPALVSEAARHVLRFGLLMLATLLTSTLELPTRMLSVVVAVAALVVGVQALRRISRAGIRGLLVVALSAGMVMTVMVALSTVVVASVWDIETERQTCEARAITHTARLDCREAYEQRLDERQDQLSS